MKKCTLNKINIKDLQ